MSGSICSGPKCPTNVDYYPNGLCKWWSTLNLWILFLAHELFNWMKFFEGFFMKDLWLRVLVNLLREFHPYNFQIEPLLILAYQICQMYHFLDYNLSWKMVTNVNIVDVGKSMDVNRVQLRFRYQCIVWRLWTVKSFYNWTLVARCCSINGW